MLQLARICVRISFSVARRNFPVPISSACQSTFWVITFEATKVHVSQQKWFWNVREKVRLSACGGKKFSTSKILLQLLSSPEKFLWAACQCQRRIPCKVQKHSRLTELLRELIKFRIRVQSKQNPRSFKSESKLTKLRSLSFVGGKHFSVNSQTLNFLSSDFHVLHELIFTLPHFTSMWKF